MRAIRVKTHGGPEVLQLEEIPAPTPAPGQVLVRIECAGVNFIDIYHRSGAYGGEVPFTAGVEAAGVVTAVGDGVAAVQAEQRVAYCMERGAYAEYAVVPVAKLVPLPADIDAATAATALLQGLTAHFLSHSTFALGPEHTAVVHAAAGGVGGLLVQMAKLRGSRVLATVSSPGKAALAIATGADRVVQYEHDDFVAAVRDFTGGRGADVVYDAVGRATFERSLQCLCRRGLLVLYGQASGAVPPVDPQTLNAMGSLFLTRPTLAHHMDEAERRGRVTDLFGWIRSGALQLRLDARFRLEAAAEAHRRLESRASMGKILLEI